MQDNVPGKLILKYLGGEASKDEQERLHQWLSEDSGHHEILAHYREIYHKKYRHAITFNVEKGLSRLDSKIGDHEGTVRRLSLKRTAWAIAAAFVVLAVTLAIFYIEEYDRPGTPSYVEKSNPYGQKSTFKLGDGSTVKLNSGSKLQFPSEFAENERRVILTGEAFFEVAKDANRPFIVYAAGISTTVLGTSFNVRAFEEEENAVVSVATGKVRVAGKAGEGVELAPAEEVIYHKKEMRMAKQASQLERVIAWKENILWFEKSPLAQVAADLEKWYGVTVAFNNDKIKGCRLTGSFTNERLTNVLESIKISTGISYEKAGNQVVFSGPACK